jgi:hypothetical protein
MTLHVDQWWPHPLFEIALVLVRFNHVASVIANADHKQSGLWTLMAAPVPSGKAQQNLTSGARNLCADAQCSHADLRFIIELGDSFVASLYSILDDPFVCLVLWPLLGSYAHPPFNPRDGIATLAPRARLVAPLPFAGFGSFFGVDIPSGQQLWSFAGDGDLTSAPHTVN